MPGVPNVPNVDIRPDHWGIVRSILQKHVPQCAVWAFGSRAKWTAKEYSDLDLAIITGEPMSLDVSASLSDDFSESDLPWKVDVVDWATTSESFRKIIEQDKVVVQKGRSLVKGSGVMGGEWEETTLGDLGRIVTGKTPLTAVEENFGGQTPFVTPSDMDGRRTIGTTARNLTEAGAASVNGAKIPAGSVMVSCIGSDMGKAVIAGRDCVTNQQINSIVVDDRFSSEFVYYNLSTRKDEIRHQAAGGSAQPILNKGDFSRLEITIPPLAEQKAIAAVLGALDDKIELNRRMNATLEAMARALFQSWFVDFEPVRAKLDGRRPSGLDQATAALFPASLQDSSLGLVPLGWEVKTLSDLTSLITKGTTPTQDDIAGGTDADLQINYVRVNSIDEDGSILPEKLTTIPKSVHVGVLKRSILKADDVLYTIAGTIGRIASAEDWILPANTNQAIAIIRPEPGIPSGFLILTMRHEVFREELHHNIVHAVQANLSLGMLSKAKIVVPPETILRKLFAPIDDVLRKISANRTESRTLAILRDTLLPKLISGEIRIKDAEQLIGDAV